MSIEVGLDVEIVTSDEDANQTDQIRAILCRSEELCGTPESSGKFDIVIPVEDGQISIRADRSIFMRILRFLEFGEPLNAGTEEGGGW